MTAPRTAPWGRLLTAMVTPMTPAGEVDVDATKVLAKALIASGTEGIVSTGSTGEANYAIPVTGPRGGGTLYIEARKSAGRWTFRVLTLAPDTGAEIDLRTPEEGAGDPAHAGEGDAVRT